MEWGEKEWSGAEWWWLRYAVLATGKVRPLKTERNLDKKNTTEPKHERKPQVPAHVTPYAFAVLLTPPQAPSSSSPSTLRFPRRQGPGMWLVNQDSGTQEPPLPLPCPQPTSPLPCAFLHHPHHPPPNPSTPRRPILVANDVQGGLCPLARLPALFPFSPSPSPPVAPPSQTRPRLLGSSQWLL